MELLGEVLQLAWHAIDEVTVGTTIGSGTISMLLRSGPHPEQVGRAPVGSDSVAGLSAA